MKDIFKRIRRQITDQEKIFVKDISNKELLSNITQRNVKFKNKKTSNPFIIFFPLFSLPKDIYKKKILVREIILLASVSAINLIKRGGEENK